MHDPNQSMPEVPMSHRDTIDLAIGPQPSRWGWLIDRNPLFLLSGVCMLGGCFLVSGAIHAYDPAEVGADTVLWMLIALLVVLNIYEFAVIGLGLFLARSQTLIRDTRHLLGLALLLVIDASFVYNETSIFSPWIGGLIAGFAALLALAKAWWIVRSLGILPTKPACAVIALCLSAMYALPVVVRLLASDGFLSQPMAMLVWCGLGVVMAAYAVPLNWFTIDTTGDADREQLQRLITAGLITLPLMSLIGHACALLWVYENAFELSMLSPILLGLAAVILRQQRRLGGPTASAKAAGIVVACAIVPSLMPADDLIVVSSTYTWLAFSPLRGALLVSPSLLAWGWWISGRGVLGGIATVLPVILAALGHTPRAMLVHGRWLIDTLSDWLPRTQLQWGALAIAAAFICLVTGGLISWKRATRESTRHHNA